MGENNLLHYSPKKQTKSGKYSITEGTTNIEGNMKEMSITVTIVSPDPGASEKCLQKFREEEQYIVKKVPKQKKQHCSII